MEKTIYKRAVMDEIVRYLHTDDIIVLHGARQVGKTSIMIYLQRQLIAQGEDVVAVDHYPPGEGGAPARHRYLDGLRMKAFVDRDDLHVWLANAGSALRGVIHLGACSDTTVTDREYVMRVNYEYTRAVWNFCARERVPLVYASSAATYGDGSKGWDDEGDPYTLEPLNLYGESKHRFDLWALEQPLEKQPPRWAGVKYFNVYGPNEDHKSDMRSVVHKAYGQILDTGRVQLFKSHRPDFKDGEQMRDFLYVKDAIRMTLHLADTPTASGLFNLGSGKAHTWLQLVNAIFASLAKQPQIDYIDMPEHLQSKYQYYTCADIAKLRESGYDTEITPLADAVRDYVVNYLVPGKHLGDEQPC